MYLRLQKKHGKSREKRKTWISTCCYDYVPDIQLIDLGIYLTYVLVNYRKASPPPLIQIISYIVLRSRSPGTQIYISYMIVKKVLSRMETSVGY